MSLVEQGKCRIDYLDADGLGVGKTRLGPVRLPYVIPDEIIEFERHSYRGKSNCLLKKIVTPSNARIEPICEYFGTCGGCLLQHLQVNLYNKYKDDLVRNALISFSDVKINPIIIIPAGQRRRANFQFLKKNGQVYLGFYRFHSHQIININHCPVILTELSNIIPLLKEVINSIFNDKARGEIFVNLVSNGIDVIIEIANLANANFILNADLLDTAKKLGIIRLVIRNQESSLTLFEEKIPFIKFGGVEVQIEADSFAQASFATDNIINEIILSTLSHDNSNIADLFCGRGTYTIPLSKYFNINGFEIDKSAVRALSNAIKLYDLPINLEQRNLFSHPLNLKELAKFKYVIINPPRAGAQAQCTILTNTRIDKVIYISCNLQSFERDAKILCEGNYYLSEVTAVDQFYYSPHLEIIGVFSLI